MCCHMYLPLPGVSFLPCEWVRRRWKPFGTPSYHFFLLKSSHKLTHTCCNTKFFPLVLPQDLSLFSLFCQSWPVSLQFWYFLPFTFTFSKHVLTTIQACAKMDNVQQGFSCEAGKKKSSLQQMIHPVGTKFMSPHHWEWGAGGASAGRHFPAHS